MPTICRNMVELETNDLGLMRIRALAIGAESVGALALGAVALGALALGAVAIGGLLLDGRESRDLRSASSS